jgi:hypothetical protein
MVVAQPLSFISGRLLALSLSDGDDTIEHTFVNPRPRRVTPQFESEQLF